MKTLFFTADDYGISPGTDDAILELIQQRRLSGTSCMTVFPEWEQSAARLAANAGKTGIGLHITLTDQPALTSASSLAPSGTLPGLPALLASIATGRISQAEISAELDAQLERFTAGIGRPPDYFDGHQHVHFLPPVRKWFAALTTRSAWLRGPAGRPALSAMTAKSAVVRTLASGFGPSMKKAGYAIRGPLDGFYDWKKPETFRVALDMFIRKSPDGAIIMVHPGHPDAILDARDSFVAARQTEYEALSSDAFAASLARHGADLSFRSQA